MESMLHNKHVQNKQEQVNERLKRNFKQRNEELRADKWAKWTKHERDKHQIEATSNIDQTMIEKLKISHELLKTERINANNVTGPKN